MATNAVGFAVLPNFIARDGEIDPPLKVLLLALSSYAGADQTCFPSNATLQAATGLSERTVRDWLRVGEQRGYLLTHRRTDPQTGAPTSNLYELNFAKWSNPMARQNLPGVSAKSAGGWGDTAPQVGRLGAPGWGDTAPPNNTSEQDQKTKPENTTPLPSVAAPTGRLLDVDEPSVASKKAKPEPRPKAASLAACPPTLAETVALFKAEGCNDTDANRLARGCLAYWESAGWKRKTGPIASWPGTVRTWLSNQHERDPGLARRMAGGQTQGDRYANVPAESLEWFKQQERENLEPDPDAGW